MTTHFQHPHKQFIRLWIDALEAVPEWQQKRGAMRVGNHFCAVGLFADLCVRNLEQYVWRECGDLEEDGVPGYGICRVGYGGMDTHGLPGELRELLGMSAAEEQMVSSWNDNGVTFAEIADRLRERYPTPDFEFGEIDWVELQARLPRADRNPERFFQKEAMPSPFTFITASDRKGEEVSDCVTP